MTKIRMNTEFRNKILNRYVDHAEKENTQEREAYLQSIEKVDELHIKKLLDLQQMLYQEHIQKKMLTYVNLLNKNMDNL